VLRKICGPIRQGITGRWRILHNEELHNLFFFTKYHEDDQIKEGEMICEYVA
jgi:hypothetical protein